MDIKRISLKSDGTQANGQSGSNSISDNGRYTIFESNATNLIPNDLNGHTDIFIYDGVDETVELITLAPDGTQANGSSSSGEISSHGNYITFSSVADNLVPNDTNGQRDIFVYDRINKTTELVSIATDGIQANGLNLFSTINANGNIVAFESIADNLVTDDTNGQKDIFVRDRANQITRRIQIGLNGAQANAASNLGSISANGRYISFSSTASNLVANDTNGKSDIFVYDRVNQTTELVSMGLNNALANDDSTSGFISDDGSFVVYESKADNLVTNDDNGKSDIFVYDRINQTTELVSVKSDGTSSNDNSLAPSISDDGSIVAFLSDASNLVADDTNARANIFIRDRLNQTTEIIAGDSFPILSGDAQSLVFTSSLDTLVSNDTNDTGDVFLLDLSSEPPVVDPPVVDPPVVEPPVVDPPVVEPPVVDPPVVEPPVVEPPVVEPPVVEPPVVDPPVVEPPVVEPPVVDPPVVEPPVVEPPVVEPPVVEPPVVDPPVVDPPVVDPPVVDPLVTRNFATDDLHRFYQFERGFHFYTADDNEIAHVREQSAAGALSYEYEAETYTVLSQDKDALTGETLEGVKPVYRFFNTETGAHLYTADENERSVIEDTLANYNFEGIQYYAFESEPTDVETIPVFRMFNSDTGSHLYSSDQNELNHIQENLPNFSFENNGDAVFHVFEF